MGFSEASRSEKKVRGCEENFGRFDFLGGMAPAHGKNLCRQASSRLLRTRRFRRSAAAVCSALALVPAPATLVSSALARPVACGCISRTRRPVSARAVRRPFRCAPFRRRLCINGPSPMDEDGSSFAMPISASDGGRWGWPEFTLDFRNQGGRLRTPISKDRIRTVHV